MVGTISQCYCCLVRWEGEFCWKGTGGSGRHGSWVVVVGVGGVRKGEVGLFEGGNSFF